MKAIHGFFTVLEGIIKMIGQFGEWVISDFPKSMGIIFFGVGVFGIFILIFMVIVAHPVFAPFILFAAGIVLLSSSKGCA